MVNCAILCEYNPFHSGHKYQLDEAKKSADNVICIMSGQFVQSGMPAFCDKSIRAKAAIMGGADAVIELPVAFSTASAHDFAFGAVKILSDIKNIKYMAMGATQDADTVLRAGEIKFKDKQEIDRAVSELMKNGKSYNVANAIALTHAYAVKYPDKDISALFDDPNNILCLEYICALNSIAPKVEPMIIKRIGTSHSEINLNCEHASATTIRQNFSTGKTDRFIPFCLDEIKNFRLKHAPDVDAYKKMLLYAVKSADTSYIRTLRDGAGIENLIVDLCSSSDFDGIVNNKKLNRFGKKRTVRLMLAALLKIDNTLLRGDFYTRLLACKSDFDFSVLPQCVKTTNAQLKCAAKNPSLNAMLKVDERASSLYNTLARVDGNYYNYSLIKI